MKAKRILFLTALVSLPCLIGCSINIVNLTPPEFSPSSTGAYTLKAQVDVGKKAVVPHSLEAFVVIDGTQHPMSQKLTDSYIFEYDYKPSAEKLLVSFYYILNYLIVQKDETPTVEQVISGFYRTQLPNTVSLRIDKERAAVDKEVSIYGDQFTRQDRVLIDGTPCETTLISSKELRFLVPEIKPSFGYAVNVFTSKGMLEAGTLRVDSAHPLTVLPNEITLKAGQPQALVFMLNHPAPYGGLHVSVTTDIPDSIISPKVLIPERTRTVSVTIAGKSASSGNLFITAGELPEIIVPITVF